MYLHFARRRLAGLKHLSRVLAAAEIARRLAWLTPLTTLALGNPAFAAETAAAPETWAVHGQATHVWQYHPAFKFSPSNL